jgi:hypothetical protein
MTMLYTIIGLFALGAIVGLYLLTLILQSKETPKAIVLLHGVFVVIALVMLIIYTTRNTPGPLESLVLFIIAAAGGLVVAYKDFTGQKIPRWLAVVHGVIALGGFIFLLAFTLG